MDKNELSGLVFTGILIICIGVGMLINQVGAATLIGVGAGFLGMAAVKWKK